MFADRKKINGMWYAREENTRLFAVFAETGLTHDEFFALHLTPVFSPKSYGIDEREVNLQRWNEAGDAVVAEYDMNENRWIDPASE